MLILRYGNSHTQLFKVKLVNQISQHTHTNTHTYTHTHTHIYICVTQK